MSLNKRPTRQRRLNLEHLEDRRLLATNVWSWSPDSLPSAEVGLSLSAESRLSLISAESVADRYDGLLDSLSTGESAGLAMTADRFLQSRNDLLQLDAPTRELVPHGLSTDLQGTTHVAYRQMHDGMRVSGAEVRVHFDTAGNIVYASGAVVTDIVADTTPVLTREEAIAAAEGFFYEQFGPVTTAELLTLSTDDLPLARPARTEEPAPGPRLGTVDLSVLNVGLSENRDVADSHLVWGVNLSSHEPLAAETYYVDAHTGRLVSQQTGIANLIRMVADVSTEDYTTPDYGSEFSLIALTIPSYPEFAGYKFGRAEASEPTGPYHPILTDHLDQTDQAYDSLRASDEYLLRTTGRDGGNGFGGTGWNERPRDRTLAYVNKASSSQGYFFSDSGSVSFGIGQGTTDIVGHEYGHAVSLYRDWDGSSDPRGSTLQIRNESGALSESFSDVFGEAVERYATGSTDWLMGAERAEGALRDLADPPSMLSRYGTPYPDRYRDPNFYARCDWFDCDDGGGVHTNSSIPNKAFYLMSEGGSFNGYEIQGIGLDNAVRVFSQAVIYYFNPYETFNQAYDDILEAADELLSTDQVAEVRKALQATEMHLPRTGALPDASIQRRYTFYNDSALDGNTPGADRGDDAAIAFDKTALLPGGLVSAANITSYPQGINGLMVDVEHLHDPSTLGTDDFIFKLGTEGDPSTWPALAGADLPEVSVRRGEGTDGADRITLVFPNHVIQNAWIEVTVKATAATGLTAEDVFYFGNLSGETGDSLLEAVVTEADVTATAAAVSEVAVGVGNPYDHNRDSLVTTEDVTIVQNNLGASLSLLGGMGGSPALVIHDDAARAALYDGPPSPSLSNQLSNQAVLSTGSEAHRTGLLAAEDDPAWTVTQLTDDTYDQYHPVISGDMVAWQGFDGEDYEIFLFNGTDTVQLTDNTTFDGSPDISGNNVVWLGDDGNDMEVFLYDGTTTVQLTDNTTWDRDPAVSGSNVVWLGWDGDSYEVFFHNGAETTKLTDGHYVESSLDISGTNVVWQSWDGASYQVFLHDGESITQLSNQPPASMPIYPAYPAIDGSNVVWQGRDDGAYEVFFHDGTSTAQLTDDTRWLRTPDISGSNVVWMAAPASLTYEIVVHNGTSTFHVPIGGFKNRATAVSGSTVVWFGRESQTYPGHDTEIWMASPTSTHPDVVIDGDSTKTVGLSGTADPVAGGNNDVLAAGNLTLSGNPGLELEWLPGEVGDGLFGGIYTIATYSGTLTGTFADPTLSAAYNGTDASVYIDTTYGTGGIDYGSGTNDAITVKLLDLLVGDVNLDGDVDVWQFDGKGDAQLLSENLNMPTGAVWGDGDFNFDGDVDVWQFDGKGDAQLLSENLNTTVDLGLQQAVMQRQSVLEAQPPAIEAQPSAIEAQSPAIEAQPSAIEALPPAIDWQQEYESMRSKRAKNKRAEAAVDLLLATDWA